MGQPNVSTSTEGMLAAGNSFVDQAGAFGTIRTQVGAEVAGLGATWTGQASTNFQNAMDSWFSSFGVIIDQLAHMAEVMGVSSNQYSIAEAEAAHQAGGLSGGLPNF